MGKDKKKSRDPEKSAALAAKKDWKAHKAALKRSRKTKDQQEAELVDGTNRLSLHDEEDVNSWLESYRKRTEQLVTTELEPLEIGVFPSPPRGNFTWTLCPSNGMIYMFGGEFYNGAENVVFDELLRWDPDAKHSAKDNLKDINVSSNNDSNNNATGRWTRILTPLPRPPPRCAHSAVFYNDAIYIFGGESATAENYHHYRDLWKFDIKKHVWEECRSRVGTPPAARSGHRAVTWRHYMIIFGGFHEALRTEIRWFNDIHVYDFQTFSWTELKYSKLARLPPPRSACNMAVCTFPSEALFIYGGYSKLNNANAPGNSRSESIVYLDCWLLPLKALVDGLKGANPPSWERISRKGEYPSTRAGTSSIVYKNKLILFGGVLDREEDHHKVESMFYDDLFALDLERRRWFPMRLKKTNCSTGRRRKKKGQEVLKVEDETEGDNDSNDEETEINDGEAISSGWDTERLRLNVFPFTDGDGNIVTETIGCADAATHGPSVALEIESAQHELTVKANTGTQMNEIKIEVETHHDSHNTLESSMSLKQSSRITSHMSPLTMPLPRINCAMAIRSNTLYIYGGVLEVGDREVTLDDCWSIDLNKRDKWTCVWSGAMHRQVWKGFDSENDSSILSNQCDEESEVDDFSECNPVNEENNEDESAKKIAKKEAKRARKKAAKIALRNEISDLYKELEGIQLPKASIGETEVDFFNRTIGFWLIEAEKSLEQVTVDQKAATDRNEDALKLARDHFHYIQSILNRIHELETKQVESEEVRKEKKKNKADRQNDI